MSLALGIDLARWRRWAAAAAALARLADLRSEIGSPYQLAMAWPELLQDLVVREPGEQQQAQLLGQITDDFRRDGTPVIKLVEALGPWLTGEDDAQRARATSVLSEVRGGSRWHLESHSGDGLVAHAAEAPRSLAAATAATAAAAGSHSCCPPVPARWLRLCPRPRPARGRCATLPSSSPPASQTGELARVMSSWCLAGLHALLASVAIVHTIQPGALQPLPQRRPAVRGALRGCLALVSRQPGALPPTEQPPGQEQHGVPPQHAPQQLPAPDEAAVVELVRTCVSHVFIRALAAADRQLALRLLAAAIRWYGDALLGANLALLEYTISSGGCWGCCVNTMPGLVGLQYS